MEIYYSCYSAAMSCITVYMTAEAAGKVEIQMLTDLFWFSCVVTCPCGV